MILTKAPEAWNNLSEQARVLIQNNPVEATERFSVAAIDGMVSAVSMYPDNHVGNLQLEAARYWGLSRVMTHLNDSLQNAGNENAKNKLHAAFVNFRAQSGLYITEITRDRLADIFKPEAQQAVLQLSLGEQLTVDVLDTITAIRLARRQYPSLGNFPENYIANTVNDNNASATNIGANLTAGYLTVLQRVIRQRYGADDEPVAATALNALSANSLQSTTLRSARLRVDVFSTYLSNYITVTDDGIVAFNPKALDPVPDVEQIAINNGMPGTLHSEAIGCPAIYVKGLIPAVISLVNTALRSADSSQSTSH